jgi:membrane protein YdbS with pleckstrin-like domain
MSGIDETKRRLAESHPIRYTLVAGVLIGAWTFLVTDKWEWVIPAVAVITFLNWVWLRPGGRLQRWREKQRRSNDEAS